MGAAGASGLIAVIAAAAAAASEPPAFIDATDAAGLGNLNATRLCLADLNSDGRPDAIIRCREAGKPDRYRVFLNHPGEDGRGVRFVELDRPTGLPAPRDGDCLVFADLDNDGRPDAVFTRYLDINNEKFTEPEDEPKRTAWLRGNGDGTFGEPRIIDAAKPATTACIAVGDVDRDGRLDLYLGNWYTTYGVSNAAFTNDLLIQSAAAEAPTFQRIPLPEDRETFDEDTDAAGRPTYGVLILPDFPTGTTSLLELNYGRRANRLWRPTAGSFSNLNAATWEDAAPLLGIDGDAVRHGRYPDWLKEIAKRDARFDRPDEKPYRSHGNTFDAAVGDIDNDGDLDLFLAEITHAWAGDSSDRSRFLVQGDGSRFAPDSRLSVDRIPPIPPRDQWPEGWYPRWNQGDLFCELADLDHDGRLDLILSSGDYPDPPPYDQRLRIFHQQPDGTFRDITPASGIDHVGSAQISIGDVDLDGDLDILVGQSFHRFTKEMIDARTPPGPVVRLFLNQTAERRAAAGTGPASITLKLVGDQAVGVNRDALGATIEIVARSGDQTLRQRRQLTGIGGHAGKQHEFLIHAGLGEASAAERITIRWPGAAPETVLENVPAGRHTIAVGATPAEP
jgi:hypothetical protein